MKCATADIIDMTSGTATTIGMGSCYTPTCGTTSANTAAGYCETLNAGTTMAITCGTEGVCVTATCAAANNGSDCYSGYCASSVCATCTGASDACNALW